MNVKLLSIFGAVALSAVSVTANAFTLDFEGVTSFASIDGFYNGGTDSEGATGGAALNYGVTFGLDAIAGQNDFEAYFSNHDSATIAAPIGSNAYLSRPGGFTSQIQLDYSSVFGTTLYVYSTPTPNDSALLKSFTLGANSQFCSGAPLCSWTEDLILSFSGVGQSLAFVTDSEASYSSGFDNIKLTPAPVPVPAAVYLLLSGLGAMGAWARRRPTQLAAAV